MRRIVTGILLGALIIGTLGILGVEGLAMWHDYRKEQAAEKKQLQLHAWQAAFTAAQGLEQKGLHVEAESALQTLLPQTEQDFSGAEPLFETLDMLGRVETAQRAFADAEPVLLRALAIAQALPPESNKLPVALEDLIMLYTGAGRAAEREAYLNKAIDLFEKNPAKYAGDLAISYDQLAEIENRKENHQESASLLEKAIEKYPAYPGPDHLYMVRAYADLGQEETTLEKYPSAEKALSEAVALGLQYMKPDDPRMAAVWTRVGVLNLKEKKYGAAERFLRQAYELVNHPADGDDVQQEQVAGGNLADLYRQTGKNADAEAIFKQIVADSTRVFGENDRETYDVIVDLGTFYRDTGKYAQAEEQFLEAEKGRETLLGPGAPATAEALSDLALLYFFERKSAMGEEAAARALPVIEEAYGADSLPVSRNLNRLGLCQRDEGKFDDAIASLKRALAIRETLLPSNHSWIILSEENLASAFEAAGNHQDALRLLLKTGAIKPPEPNIALLN